MKHWKPEQNELIYDKIYTNHQGGNDNDDAGGGIVDLAGNRGAGAK